MNKVILLLFCSLLLFSCKEDDPSLCGSSNCYDDGLFILNEGLFQNANSSVTFYNPNDMQSENGIYFANNIIQLGDVLQSGQRYNGDLYLVVNNSQKVIKVNPSTFDLQGTIPVTGSPRYFHAVSNDKAYVTDLFGPIHIIDLTTNSVSSSIAQQGWTEEMVAHSDYLYICKRYFDGRKSQLLKLNTTSDQIEDSLELRPGAGSIVQDINNNLWVLCSGDTADEDSSALIQIDIAGFNILKTIGIHDKTSFGGPGELFIDESGQTLYYLNVSLFRLNISDITEPAHSFIAAAGRNFYDFAISPASGEIYICDAVDFVQNGKVYRYDSSGNLLDEIPTGIAPGEIVF